MTVLFDFRYRIVFPRFAQRKIAFSANFSRKLISPN